MENDFLAIQGAFRFAISPLTVFIFFAFFTLVGVLRKRLRK